MKLTDATVKALKPRPRIYEVYDDEVECFGVRVCPGGAKTFTFFYRLGGRKKRLNFGEFPFVTMYFLQGEIMLVIFNITFFFVYLSIPIASYLIVSGASRPFRML